jgi:flagellar basal body rod protein FlgC
MQYYPQRNKNAAARGYVKQSIKAVRYIIDELESEREFERESRL